MLWPTATKCALSIKERVKSKATLVSDTPYVFSVLIERATGERGAELLIEDPGTGVYINIEFNIKGFLLIDGLTIKESVCQVFDSLYSYVDKSESDIDIDYFIALLPINFGSDPRVFGEVIKQATSISIASHSDAFVIAFDEFHRARFVPVCDDFSVEVSTEGFLASLVFSGKLGAELRQKCTARGDL
jgi:hypothetical protein